MASWDSPAATATSWDSFLQTNPFGGSSSWWTQGGPPQRFTYNQRLSANQGLSYQPAYGGATIYQPYSGFTQNIIDSSIDDWIRRTHPELFQFNTDQFGNLANTGRVGSIPGFGGFDNTADAAIQSASQQYGVPANFLKSIIMRESTGIWSDPNHSPNAVAMGSRPGEYIYGYVGVTKSAAESRVPGVNFASLNGNLPGQVGLLAAVLRSQYDELKAKDPNTNWLNVAAYHYSGDPSGATTPADSTQYGSTGQYMSDIRTFWSQLDKAAGNQFDPNFQPGGAAGSLNSPSTPDWQRINQWDQYIMAAAQQTGVPANLIKAVMRIESGGDPSARSPAGALGLMQVMPDGGWAGEPVDTARALSDPQYNILMGARELRAAYEAQGQNWDMAVRAYHGFGSDGYTTDQDYLAKVKSYENELSSGLAYGGTGSPTQTFQTAAIFGGTEPPTSQGIETNDWTRANPGMYAYGRDYGLYNGEHPGVDYVVPSGTKLYAPVAGTVEMAGGTGYYMDDQLGNQPYTGELMIRLDNGDDLILGHMSQIAVQVGQRVQPGFYVGLSGFAGSGDHVHVEYRMSTPGKTPSGFTVVDPRTKLNGSFAGVYQQGVTGAGIDRPMTFQDMMLAAASGQPIRMGATLSSGSGWHDFLLAAMQGKVAPVAPGAPGYKRAGTYSGNVSSAFTTPGFDTPGATP